MDDRQENRVSSSLSSRRALRACSSLAGGIAAGGHFPASMFASPTVGTAALVGGLALLAGAVIWLSVVRSKRDARRAIAEVGSLKRSLAAADALIRAEPQILLFWEQDQPLRVVAHTLHGIPGLPDTPEKFLRFGQWLEPNSAAALKPALDALFKSGQPFNLIVRTVAGGHVEADGRAAGGRAVLRFRDVAGYRHEVAQILAQHQRLARDVRASRALLDALPIPVWLRSKDGRLTWVNNAYVRAVEAAAASEVHERQIELLEQRQRARRGTRPRPRRELPRAPAAHRRRRAQAARRDRAAVRGCDGRRRHRRDGARERAGRARAPDRRLRPHARPRRDRRRDLQCASSSSRSSTRPIASCGSSTPTG